MAFVSSAFVFFPLCLLWLLFAATGDESSFRRIYSPDGDLEQNSGNGC
jgi:hypothetical protein